MLWLDSEADRAVALKTPGISRLVARGLEVNVASPMGPHGKYYPYVASTQRHSLPLVTADDDILYPSTWLQRLIMANAANPDVIHCFRAHEMTVVGGSPSPYMSWPPAKTNNPSFASFLTGVSGVIYPPSFLDHLHEQGEAFRTIAPKADDVWIHSRAVSSGVRIAQLGAEPVLFPVTLGTQRAALWRHNAGGNDEQIAAAYSSAALRLISDDLQSPSRLRARVDAPRER